jgi:hypothetical protein
MGVGVSGQQCRLEEKQAGGPNACGPTEPGQDVLPEQELHAEEQKRAEEDCDSEKSARNI